MTDRTMTNPLKNFLLCVASVAFAGLGPIAPVSAAADDDARLDIYTTVPLTADLSHLSDRQKRMVSLLIDAAEITDALFWRQHWGDREALLESLPDARIRRFAEINYGPWDLLDNDQPFVEGYGPRPPGARFYPADMTRAEFEAWDQPGKDGLYSIVKRNRDGELVLIPYHEAFGPELERAADLLRGG